MSISIMWAATRSRQRFQVCGCTEGSSPAADLRIQRHTAPGGTHEPVQCHHQTSGHEGPPGPGLARPAAGFRTGSRRLLLGGKVKCKETVVKGLDQAVGAFLGLFSGQNIAR